MKRVQFSVQIHGALQDAVHVAWAPQHQWSVRHSESVLQSLQQMEKHTILAEFQRCLPK